MPRVSRSIIRVIVEQVIIILVISLVRVGLFSKLLVSAILAKWAVLACRDTKTGPQAKNLNLKCFQKCLIVQTTA